MKYLSIFILIFLSFTACTKLSKYDKRSVNKALKDTLTHKTESWDVHMRLLEGHHKQVLLTSPYAATYAKDKGSETHFKGPVKITVKDSTGKVTTTVRCDKAIFKSKKSVFEFMGNVVVKTDKKKTLRSEFLKWLQKKNKIQTPNYVVITTPTDSISGYGLKGNDDLSNYVIKKVKGKVSVK